MELPFADTFRLSDIRLSDKTAYVQHLNNKDIYDRTLNIPFPYTAAEAEAWLAKYTEATNEQREPVTWAIRTSDEHLIGGLGFTNFQLGKSHRAEIGYWLAKPYWGQGIMTAAVQSACHFAFTQWQLVKIVAHVFAHNPASARVLEKAGFEQEGYFKQHFLKDGRLIDARFYARLQ